MLYWLIQHDETGYYNEIICTEGQDPLRGLSAFSAIRFYDTHEECAKEVERLNFEIWRSIE